MLTFADMLRIKFCCIFLILLYCKELYSQKNVEHQDLIWYGINVKIGLNDDYSLKQEIENRMYWFPWRQHVVISRTQLEKKLNPNLSTAVGLTYLLQSLPNDPEIEDFSNFSEIRPQLNFILQQKLSEKWKLQHRYQTEFRFMEDNEGRIRYSNNRSRYKFEAAYKINEACVLKAYDEIHINIGKKTVQNVFDQNRIGASVQYMPWKNTGIEAGYFNWFQQRSNSTDFYSRDIFRITLLHNIQFKEK